MTDSVAKAVPSSPPRLLRIGQVVDRVGLKRSEVYQRAVEGTFPRQIKIGPKAAAWIESEINEWIEQRIRDHRAK